MKKKATKKKKVLDYIFTTFVIMCVGVQVVSGAVVIKNKIVEMWRDHHPVQEVTIVQEGQIQTKEVPIYNSKDRAGACGTKDFEAEVQVYLTSDNLPEGVEGRFTIFGGGKPTITILKGTDYTNVIAHEVSHWVDAIVGSKGINDTETRAYLQGYFTQCVTDLINKKLLLNKN